MSSERIQFKNGAGHLLSAMLDMPVDQKPVTCAIFAHCFTCSKDLKSVQNITRALNQNSIAVLRFDFTGLGKSEGAFVDSSFTSNIEDLESAAAYMGTRGMFPEILIGHSLGGAAVLFASSRIESIKAVATIGAPSDPMHVQHLLKSGLEEIEKNGHAEIDIGGRPFNIGKQFLDDLKAHDMKSHLHNLRKALLFMHSPQDQIVEINNAADLYTSAHHPKSFISLDGADHLLSKEADSNYVGTIIANWVRRYIEQPKVEALQTDHQVISRIGNVPYTVENGAGDHHWLSDEPKEVGGQDLGPSPYELLLSSLGSCTTITLRMYANRKNWDLQEVDVHLNHAKKHAVDSDGIEDPSTRLDHLERKIELKGNLDESQRQRLLEIADKCPVHKTLSGDIQIDSSLI